MQAAPLLLLSPYDHGVHKRARPGAESLTRKSLAVLAGTGQANDNNAAVADL